MRDQVSLAVKIFKRLSLSWSEIRSPPITKLFGRPSLASSPNIEKSQSPMVKDLLYYNEILGLPLLPNYLGDQVSLAVKILKRLKWSET